MNKQMIEMDDLLEALSRLFMLDTTIICRSLRILRAILEVALSWDNICSKQGCIITTKPECSHVLEQKNIGSKLNDSSNFLKDEESYQNHMCISASSQILIVKHMQKILTRNSNHQIQLEALSVVQFLIIQSDPCSEREKIGLIVFRVLPKLMHADRGPHVQKRAVQILFLLLNSLKLLKLFCTGFKDFVCQEEIDDQKCEHQMKPNSLEEASIKTLEGLVHCIKCGGDSVAELKLQMEVVNVLAFIAASGEQGFKIMLRPVSPEEHNFLDLIIQVLAHQMDQEDNGLAESVDICKERISLRREALILLNRLASNSYSMHALGTLTRTYLSAGLVLDVADRISHRRKGRWKYGSMKSLQPMDDETIDLARSFGARVLTFIG